MKNRYKLLVLAVAILGLLNFSSKVYAAPTNNPFQATIAVVEQMILNALTPLNTSLNNHEERIAELESNVQELETRIEQLEATPTPTVTPTPILTPTPDLLPFEASLSREGNKFTIVSNKIITDCRYTSKSPTGNLEITGGSNNANGTNTCELTLLNSG